MRKNIVYAFIVVFMFFIANIKIFAIKDLQLCDYKGESASTYWASIDNFRLVFKEVDEHVKIKIDGYKLEGDDLGGVIAFGSDRLQLGPVVHGDLLAGNEYDAKYYYDSLDGNCPAKIKICKATNVLKNINVVFFDAQNATFMINKNKIHMYNTEAFKSREQCDSRWNDCGWGILDYTISDDECSDFRLTDSHGAEKKDLNNECRFYEKSKDDLIDLVGQYEDCINNKSQCSISNIVTKHNSILAELKNTCKAYISYMSYDDTCMNECLDLNNKLRNAKALISEDQKIEKCSISDDIVSMIYNVIKWAKYIVPVLVIILSILDFIKAIAAQNDDEMKKAQGRFVKRLIVAALLFLIPLIINFALKTFGMYNSSCDITDLF